MQRKLQIRNLAAQQSNLGNNLISWGAMFQLLKLQATVAPSMCKKEFRAGDLAECEALWLSIWGRNISTAFVL